MYFKLAFLLIVLLALWLRLFNIEMRPMHGDEANQAYRFSLLHEEGKPVYDARDYHGPTLYYFMRPVAWVQGKSYADLNKADYRLLTVFFSMLTLFLCLAFKDALGELGTLSAALLMAVSPAMVYYSKYFIQESLLVFFSLAFLAATWQFYCNRESKKKATIYALLSGLSSGFLLSTKETCVLFFAACLCAVFFLKKDRLSWLKEFWRTKRIHVIQFCVSMGVIYVIFYSAFFTHPQGLVEPITGISSHIQRGLGSDDLPENTTAGAAHTKSFDYYLNLLIGSWRRPYHETGEVDYSKSPRSLARIFESVVKNQASRPVSEILICLLALVGFVLIAKYDQSSVAKFWLYYTVFILLFYSLIPYKTPWCVLSSLLGFCFLGGYGVKLINKRIKNKSGLVFVALILGLGIVDLIRQNILLSDLRATDNPYAYSQSLYNVEDLLEQVDSIALSNEKKENLDIHFFTSDYWPLPWYLRNYQSVAYWDQDQPDDRANELEVIIFPNENEDLFERLESTHTFSLYGFRRGTHLTLACRNDLWQELLKHRENKEMTQ